MFKVIKGSTIGDLVIVNEIVGYEWNDDECYYEPIEQEFVDNIWRPHEEVIGEFNSYEDAKKIFNEEVNRFKAHHLYWPWNQETSTWDCDTRVLKSEFSDGDNSIWFKLTC